MKNEKSVLVTHGFHSQPSTNLSLKNFVTLLDKALTDQHLHIINGPHMTSIKTVLEGQKEIEFQTNHMQNWGLLCGSTQGMMHLLPLENDATRLRILSREEVCEYYKQQAKITLQRKKCTCDGLSAVALELARNMISKEAIKDITVEICSLNNWSHSLIHLSKKNDNSIEGFFYDPWYQRCYTNTPEEAKIISEDQLGIELEKLIAQTKMIQHTETVVDVDSFAHISNTQRDYSYVVACSTGKFENPAPVIADPTVRYSFCNLI